MKAFRDMMHDCGLVDLGFRGLPWTYNNKQSAERNVRVRLDRAIATTNWSHLFPGASVEHLVSPRSDHCPLLIKLTDLNERRHNGKCQRYEIMWERQESLEEEIKEAWLAGLAKNDLGHISDALKHVMKNLKTWSHVKFGSVCKQLEAPRTQLTGLQRQQQNEETRKQIIETTRKMDEMLYREEMLWLQRSRIMWLKEGDRNTKYFHRKAVWRARKNKIRRLKKEDGQWTDCKEEMESMATSFFQNMYTADP
jgi:hypothetical protein